jgi:hypothetical protein
LSRLNKEAFKENEYAAMLIHFEGFFVESRQAKEALAKVEVKLECNLCASSAFSVSAVF